MRRRLRLPFWGTVGLCVGALVAVAVWLAGLGLLAYQDNLASTEVDRGPRDKSPVLYGKYRRLAVCIQLLEGLPADAAYVQGRVGTVFSAFRGVRSISPSVPYADFPPLVDLGCPRFPARLTSDYDGHVADRPGTSVPDPSPYHIPLFVVSPATRETILRGYASRRIRPTVEEYATDNPGGGQAIGMTSGLYVTVGDFADLSTVEAIFEETVFLDRIVPIPTPTGPRPIPRPVRP